MIQLAVILGSTRPGRRGDQVASWVMDVAQRHRAVQSGIASMELVDLASIDLPLLDEPAPAMLGSYSRPRTKVWADVAARFDGFIFVNPEYNHSISAALKNAIDHLYAEWNDKAAGFVSYGVNGGVRAAEHLRQVLAEVRIATVRPQVALSIFTDFRITDPTQPGEFAPAEFHQETLHELLDDVVSWSTALRNVRAAAGEAVPVG